MILVVNAGSSSIKIPLFELELTKVIAGQVSGMDGHIAQISINIDIKDRSAPNHETTLSTILASLATQGITNDQLIAAAHRVVHGGTALVKPCQMTDNIDAETPLAPLHNSKNLAGICALQTLETILPEYASFGNAFHAANQPISTTYAIPKKDRNIAIHRYSFHRLSYVWIVKQFEDRLPDRLLSFNLGSGVSLCAIHNSQSVATTVEYLPLDDLSMSTRSGAIDGIAVLRMAQIHGIDEASRRLNKDSGLKGFCGANDIRLLLESGTKQAKYNLYHFRYWIARQAGRSIVAMGSLVDLAFTGGVGQNSTEFRNRIMATLKFLGNIPVHMIEADQERQIALDPITLGVT